MRRTMQSCLTALFVALACPALAAAVTTAPGYEATPYATGFPFDSTNRWGPIGVAFDTSDNLYVSDFFNSHLYRFQPGGGVASATTQLTTAGIPGGIKGLSFTRGGHLYLARASAGDIVEIDQGSGGILRRAVGGLTCPTALATDPVSGDLFASQVCRPQLVRISGLAGGPVRTSTYAAVPADGIAFGPDGTLYAASGGQVLEIDGTSSPTPGLTRSVAMVPAADGIAVGVPPAGGNAFLVVNRTDGKVTRLDFSTTPPGRQDIMTGGSRGDFVAVNSQGCLFITQTSSVMKIVPPGRKCDLAPSTPGTANSPAPGIKVDTLPPTGRQGCVVKRKLKVRVRQRGRVRLRFIRVYVKGKYRKTVRNRRVSAPIVIKHVPRGRFTVKLVARTTKGKKLTAKRRYRNCPRR